MTYYLHMTGLLGIVIPLTAVLLLALGVVLWFTARSRLLFVLYGMASLLPLLIGAVGTVRGMIVTMNVIAMSDAQPKPSELAEGIWASLLVVLVGAVASLPPLALAGAGVLRKGSRTQ